MVLLFKTELIKLHKCTKATLVSQNASREHNSRFYDRKKLGSGDNHETQLGSANIRLFHIKNWFEKQHFSFFLILSNNNETSSLAPFFSTQSQFYTPNHITKGFARFRRKIRYFFHCISKSSHLLNNVKGPLRTTLNNVNALNEH